MDSEAPARSVVLDAVRAAGLAARDQVLESLAKWVLIASLAIAGLIWMSLSGFAVSFADTQFVATLFGAFTVAAWFILIVRKSVELFVILDSLASFLSI